MLPILATHNEQHVNSIPILPVSATKSFYIVVERCLHLNP